MNLLHCQGVVPHVAPTPLPAANDAEEQKDIGLVTLCLNCFCFCLVYGEGLKFCLGPPWHMKQVSFVILSLLSSKKSLDACRSPYHNLISAYTAIEQGSWVMTNFTLFECVDREIQRITQSQHNEAHGVWAKQSFNTDPLYMSSYIHNSLSNLSSMTSASTCWISLFVLRWLAKD